MHDQARHARHVALPGFGRDGVRRLRGSRVLLVGLGGLGCPAAQYLAGAGVGELVLNDFDRVDESNLARQLLYTPADVGRLKVDAAADALRRLNPDVRVQTLDRRLSPEELAAAVADAALVLDGSDNLATRLNVNAACVAAGTPLVSGAVIRLEGQLMVFPNDRGDAPCYRCVYREDDEGLGDCQGSGVLGPAAGAIGCLMAAEALKLLAGLTAHPAGRLLLIDLADWSVRTLRTRRDPDCPVCHDAAARGTATEPAG